MGLLRLKNVSVYFWEPLLVISVK